MSHEWLSLKSFTPTGIAWGWLWWTQSKGSRNTSIRFSIFILSVCFMVYTFPSVAFTSATRHFAVRDFRHRPLSYGDIFNIWRGQEKHLARWLMDCVPHLPTACWQIDSHRCSFYRKNKTEWKYHCHWKMWYIHDHKTYYSGFCSSWVLAAIHRILFKFSPSTNSSDFVDNRGVEVPKQMNDLIGVCGSVGQREFKGCYVTDGCVKAVVK